MEAHRKVVKLYIFTCDDVAARVKRLECRRTKVPKSVDAFLRVFHFLHASSEISSEKCVSEKAKMERSCRTTTFREK